MNDILKQALFDREIISKDDITNSKEYILDNLYVGDAEKLKKDLMKIGVDLYK